jgi:hypothetical protein
MTERSSAASAGTATACAPVSMIASARRSMRSALRAASAAL